MLQHVAFTLSAEAAQRLLQHFQIKVSSDTLLRIIRQTEVEVYQSAQVIGIDDWAIKKGRTYGTLIVDLEQHRVLEVLPERSATVVREWLSEYNQVEIVARDRSTEYATGIQAGAPQAIQVADRWHLLLNLRQMLDRFLSTIYPALQYLPLTPEHVTLLSQRRTPFRRTSSEQLSSQMSREKRLATYEHIQQLRADGYNISQIATLLGHHWETVRKYYEAPQFPERKQRQAGRSILDPYVPYLQQRLDERCENALQLWREIRQQGYPGSARQVSKWTQLRRTTPAPSTPGRYRQTSVRTSSLTSLLPSSKHIAWLLVRDPDTLAAEDIAVLQHIDQHEDLPAIYQLAQQFVRMVKHRLPDQLDPWLKACEAVSAIPLQNFAVGLRQDYDAVRAALETSWSNGQTEGQVNRLKVIKRQMYGRANFDLLRLKVLYSSGFT